MGPTAIRTRIAPTTRTAALLGATVLTALAATGCGSGGDGASSSTTATGTASSTATASEIDRAFVSQMVPHHRMAVQMAAYAPTRGQHAEIRRLGRSITAGQTAEIAQMRAAAKALGATVAEGSASGGGMDDDAHGGTGMAAAARTLGIPMADMGMSMDMASLAKAEPFDRAFIDEMIPHHRGAILMARAELARGGNAELRRIATAIVAEQTTEIERMNAWRTRWYGAASPAGGVPAA